MFRSYFYVLICMAVGSYSQSASLVDQLRAKYHLFPDQEALCEQFERKLSQHITNDPICRVYFGAIKAVSAKFPFNPYTKLKRFNEGKTQIEKAVKGAPNSMEVRFIRFTIQSESPSMLGYQQNVESDRDFILAHVEDLKDNNLKHFICSYMIKSDRCTDTQKQTLSGYLAELE